MAFDECETCGVGHYLPSGVCDHCNTQRPKPKPIKLCGGPHDGLNVGLIAADLCFFFVFDKRTKRLTMYERSERARDAGEDFTALEAPISGALGCCLVLG